jgi:hypothetical protein
MDLRLCSIDEQGCVGLNPNFYFDEIWDPDINGWVALEERGTENRQLIGLSGLGSDPSKSEQSVIKKTPMLSMWVEGPLLSGWRALC